MKMSQGTTIDNKVAHGSAGDNGQDSAGISVHAMLETCAGCSICKDFCPAFFNVFEYFSRRDIFRDGLVDAVTSDRFLDQCFQCDRCTSTCPLNFDFSRISWDRKVTRKKRHSVITWPGRWLLGSRRAAFWARWFAPVFNFILKSTLFRIFLEWAGGVDRRVRLPVFANGVFSQWFRKRPQRAVSDSVEIAFFTGCDGECVSVDRSRKAVELLEVSGFRVASINSTCCGRGKFEEGDATGARLAVLEFVAAASAGIEAGQKVVVGDPQCMAMLRLHAGKLLSADTLAAGLAVIEQTEELIPFLWKAARAGRFPKLEEQIGRVAYHSSCHARAMKSDGAGSGILSLVPGLEVTRIDVGCCGAGTVWGWKTGSFEASQAAVYRITAAVTGSGCSQVVTDCSRCRLQLEQANGDVKVSDALELFRLSTSG